MIKNNDCFFIGVIFGIIGWNYYIMMKGMIKEMIKKIKNG